MTQTIYQLSYGEYDDEHTVGMFASRELAERQIVRDALSGKRIEGAHITEHQLVIDDIDSETPEV